MNDPVRRSHADYERARQRLVQYASGHPDIVAVFEYGTVQVPGLSDVDVIVVLAERPKADIADYLSPLRLPREVREVMDGATLMVMAEPDFPDIVRWDDVRLRCLYGKPLQAVHLSGEAARRTEGCRIVDWLPWHAARLTRLLTAPTVPVRQTLGQMRSLTYSLHKLRHLFGVWQVRWGSYLDRITALRAEWFADPAASRQDFLSLLVMAQQTACEALATLGSSRTMAARDWYGRATANLEGRLDVPGGLGLHFTPEARLLRENLARGHISDAQTIIHLPGVLLRHFAAYGAEPGPISGAIHRALHPSVATSIVSDLPTPLRAVLRQRIAACNRWAAFLHANGFRGGLFKFAWFYRPPIKVASGSV